MQSVRIYLCALGFSVCVLTVGIFNPVDADSVTTRPLAATTTAVEVDGAMLTGNLVEKDGRVFAVFAVQNETAEAQKVEFNYAVFQTMAASPMMRMMPAPAMVRSEPCAITVAAGKTERKVILLEGAVVSKHVKLDGMEPMEDTWNLVVSGQEVTEDAGWGAAPPMLRAEGLPLGDGQVTLASSMKRDLG